MEQKAWLDEGKGKLAANARKRVAAGRSSPGFSTIRNAQSTEQTIAWTAVSFLGDNTRYSFFPLQWTGLRTPLETGDAQWCGLGPMYISGELGHLTTSNNFLA